jgi:hypothetical protein
MANGVQVEIFQPGCTDVLGENVLKFWKPTFERMFNFSFMDGAIEPRIWVMEAPSAINMRIANIDIQFDRFKTKNVSLVIHEDMARRTMVDRKTNGHS